MKTRHSVFRSLLLVSALVLSPIALLRAVDYQVLSWNNLGMHCMDSDYSVFTILPPYNTIEAQLIAGGKLVTNNGAYTITYQAVADPDGSFNSTSQGKGNFFDYTAMLYGAVPMNMGLAGWGMPGTNNTPQLMMFENTNTFALVNWFRAEGIPLTPYDDSFRKNPYPMMRIVARDMASNIVAKSAIVLPVSDEMDCRACHASGTQAAAQPAAGWVWDANAERDYRLNILRLHDERNFTLHPQLYTNALAARGFNASGLYANVASNGAPILCAVCHASEALGTAGYSTTPPLTTSVHAHHASVIDPTQGITLDNFANRSACYRCHPGSTTRCLRGAMGAAIAADGSMEMQCQSCHGNMSAVGAANRIGWLMEPNCQNCHTGPATHNNGQIRYTSAFDVGGAPRVAVDQTFATSSNTPVAGLSLYRFSSGHGGLQCEACHGSTHAEFPSSHANDNIRNIQLQGHVGVMVECTACHVTVPNTVSDGPHGLHPVGQSWVNQHGDMIENGGLGTAQCQACHGLDYRGTVLSRAQADRQLVANSDTGTATIQLFRGAEVTCYACHNGPSDDTINSTPPPTVSNISTNTPVNQSVAMTLPATGANPTLRIISQPTHGSVGLAGTLATYFPETNFTGIDNFTFAAFDGSKNSLLGYAAVAVGMPMDHTPPVVKIVSPTTAATYNSSSAALSISGTATDNVAIASITWSSDRGGSGPAIGTTNWSADGIALQSGVNVITVTARDTANNTATDTLTVTYSTTASLVVNVMGQGTVSPNLNGQILQAGRSYTLTAKPAAGYVFVNWTGSLLASTPALTFVFQTNMVLQANFAPNPFNAVAGVYNGLFGESEIRQNSSGAFTLSVSSSGAFSGKFLASTARYSATGQFDSSGHAHVNIPRANMAALGIDLQLDLAGGSDQVHGTVSDGAWTATLDGNRAVFDGKTNLAPQAGRYTLTVSGGTNAAVMPGDYSIGTLSVSAAGQIRFAGYLADGTKVSQTTIIAKDGRWPCFAPISKGQGILWSWITVSNTAAGGLNGNVSWIKQALPGAAYYPSGFTMQADVAGSRYVPPVGATILNFTDGSLTLTEGNLAQNLTNQITLNPNNTVTGPAASKLKLSFTATTGAFKGTVLNPATSRSVSFQGVVLQNQNCGRGMFLGTNQSGEVYLGP